MAIREPQFEIGSFHTIGRTKYIVESVNASKATLRALKTGKVKVVELGGSKNVKISAEKTLLSLDPSTSSCGYAIFKDGNLYKSGQIQPRTNLSVEKRICFVVDRLDKLIDEYGVTEVISENIYYGGLVDVYEALSMLKGVIYYICNSKKVKVEYVLPSVWKSHMKIARRDSAEGKRLAIELCKKKTGKKYPEDESEAILIGMWKLGK